MTFKKKFSKIRLYYNGDSPLQKGASVRLFSEKAHYVKNVMRAKLGDSVLLFDGISGEWSCVISCITGDRVEVSVNELLKEYLPSRKLALCISLVKTDTMRSVVRQATELGVTLIKPVRTEYSSVNDVNIEKCRLWAIEAAEQCGRLDIPEIASVGTYDQIPELGYRTILCDETGGGRKPQDVICGEGDLCIVIGPEGGFSHNELRMAESFCEKMSLGSRILRVDTAVVAALVYVNEHCA